MLNAATYDRLMEQIQNDCALLEALRVMDYSMLLGVHYLSWGPEEWHPPKIKVRTENLQTSRCITRKWDCAQHSMFCIHSATDMILQQGHIVPAGCDIQMMLPCLLIEIYRQGELQVSFAPVYTPQNTFCCQRLPHQLKRFHKCRETCCWTEAQPLNPKPTYSLMPNQHPLCSAGTRFHNI